MRWLSLKNSTHNFNLSFRNLDDVPVIFIVSAIVHLIRRLIPVSTWKTRASSTAFEKAMIILVVEIRLIVIRSWFWIMTTMPPKIRNSRKFRCKNIAVPQNDFKNTYGWWANWCLGGLLLFRLIRCEWLGLRNGRVCGLGDLEKERPLETDLKLEVLSENTSTTEKNAFSTKIRTDYWRICCVIWYVFSFEFD